ncbi:MAG TPA: phosphoribosylanthranilate isomerase [Gemmatimonadaceae bacterium]|nr:phosphoribosylanthranilate isomerase [Gemmatimonadaceae bacterium]
MKFCGLTRPGDAVVAASLGARYVGVIFAGGPRLVDAERAAAILRDVPTEVRRVGVFARIAPEELADIAREARLDVVQLHSDPGPGDVDAVRRHFGGEVWAVARTADESLPPGLAALFAEADAVVLDAKVPGALGGTGVRLPWDRLARPVAAALHDGGAGSRLVLAGGLTPENVATAVAALSPDVVDVSSGVEAGVPGVKDHGRMQAFASAVRGGRAASATPTSAPQRDASSNSRTSIG